jgi:hypothetical protein
VDQKNNHIQIFHEYSVEEMIGVIKFIKITIIKGVINPIPIYFVGSNLKTEHKPIFMKQNMLLTK